MLRASCPHIYPPIDLYNRFYPRCDIGIAFSLASPPRCDIGIVFYFDLSPRCDIGIGIFDFDLSPQVEGGQQHLLIDQQNPMALARRPSTDFLPLVGCKEYHVLDLHLLFRCRPP